MMQLEINALHYRDGRIFSGKPALDEKGKPYTSHIRKCSRCGGAGGSEKWRFTGWTCFECGGSGKGGLQIDKLYTLGQLEKMNVSQAKREAKAAEKRAAQQAAESAARATRRARFVEANKALFEEAAALNDSFVDEMVSQCIDRARISDAQIDLIRRKQLEKAAQAVEDTRKEAGNFVGEVGVRREFSATLEKFFDWTQPSGFRTFYRYCHILRDATGNTIKYVGSTTLGGVGYNHETETWVVDKTYGPITFKATIKTHEEYKGEKQTIVERPKLVEAK